MLLDGTRKEVAMVDARWLIIGILILCIAGIPFFLIALGFGWAWRGVAAVAHHLEFSPRSPIVLLEFVSPKRA